MHAGLRGSRRHAWKGERELVAAQSERNAPRVRVAKDVRERRQHPVAAHVALTVVEVLEVVDVDHRDRHDRSVVPALPDRAHQALLIGTMIPQAGQGVGQGSALEPRDLGAQRFPGDVFVVPKHEEDDAQTDGAHERRGDRRAHDRVLRFAQHPQRDVRAHDRGRGLRRTERS